MDERIARFSDAELPIWGWYRSYGKQAKPDRRRALYRSYRKSSWALLELEIPDSEVLLSDFIDWHCVLNDYPNLPDEAWETMSDAEIDALTDKEKLDSWLDILKGVDERDHVQACFWEIRPEYLKKVW